MQQLREQHLYYQDRLLPISRVIPHPHYYMVENGADIALLQLEEPVSISRHVQPVTLPPAIGDLPESQCWVTGWGDGTMEVSVGDPRMRWGQAPGSGVSSGVQGPHR